MERIQRILSARGVASRRVAEEMIQAGRVSVNGVVITELGTKADPERDDIRVDGQSVRRQRTRYIVLNKPRDYITTTADERDRKTVMELVKTGERVYPVGRLDRDTEGLLLLTNDGELANRIMHPRYGLEKEYHVLTDRRPTPETLQKVRTGLPIDGKKVVPNDFRIFREIRDGVVLTISLHEGMFHVVRRMMDAAGIEVKRLMRVRVGPISVTGVALGTWRDLSAGEQQSLFEAVHLDMPDSEAASRRETELVDEQRRARRPIVSRGPRPTAASRDDRLPEERLAERQARPAGPVRPAAQAPGPASRREDPRPPRRDDDRRPRPAGERPTGPRPSGPRADDRQGPRPTGSGPRPAGPGPRPGAPATRPGGPEQRPGSQGPRYGGPEPMGEQRPQRRFNPQRDDWGQANPPAPIAPPADRRNRDDRPRSHAPRRDDRPAPAPAPAPATGERRTFHRDTRPRPGASYNPRWTDRHREADERAAQGDAPRRDDSSSVRHDGRPVKLTGHQQFQQRREDDQRGPRQDARPPFQRRDDDQRGPRQDARPPFQRREDDQRGPRQDARPPFQRRDDDQRGPRQDARPPFQRRDDDQRGPRQDARPPFQRRDDDQRGPRQDARPPKREPERNDRVKVWRKEGLELPSPTPRNDDRSPRPRRVGPGEQRTSERTHEPRGPRPPAGDRDRRPGGGGQDDRRGAPRRPRRGDAV